MLLAKLNFKSTFIQCRQRHVLKHGLDHGLWTMDCGPWTVDHGLWTMDCGLWTVDYGLWTMDCVIT